MMAVLYPTNLKYNDAQAQAFIQTHRHGTNEGLHPAPSEKMLPPQN